MELRICFSKNPPQSAPLFLGGQEVPVVTTTKYLGYHLDSDLSGDTHIEQVVRKASRRLHFLTVQARHGLLCEDLLTIQTAVVRPCLEYGSVLLVGCNQRQATLLERVQKRALKIISRGRTPPPQLPSLQSRREQAAIQLVKEMTHTKHPLHDLLPQTRADNTNRLLRNSNNFTQFRCRTNRLKAATLPTAVRLYNTTTERKGTKDR